MKKILLLSVLVLSLCSCGIGFYQEKSLLVDLREFSGDKDFIINPSKIANGEFTPIGMLCLEFKSGGRVKGEMKEYVKSTGSYWYEATYKRMVSKAVEEAKLMGANGIIDFDIKAVYGKVTRSEGTSSKIVAYEVTGIPVIYKK